MKVSHEVPLKYLELSKKFNDYDYALVHLFVDHPEYLEFFKHSIAEGREVILDNSAYEITTHPELLEKYPAGYFPEDLYAQYIKELKPTYYVLPDVKDDYMNTINVIRRWNCNHNDIKGKTIGVAHGKNFDELQKCYNSLRHLCDKIAFSFESWWFDYAKEKNIPLGELRYRIINELNICRNKSHHILGCILPQEFKLWRDIPWVESIDTSAPITNAIEGVELQEYMNTKPKTTIHSSFELDFDPKIANRMEHNAQLFRKYYIN